MAKLGALPRSIQSRINPDSNAAPREFQVEMGIVGGHHPQALVGKRRHPRLTKHSICPPNRRKHGRERGGMELFPVIGVVQKHDWTGLQQLGGNHFPDLVIILGKCAALTIRPACNDCDDVGE